MRKLLACLSLILMTSCGMGANECTWAKKFIPDGGFETRWTVGEKRQAVALNEKVEEFCR